MSAETNQINQIIWKNIDILLKQNKTSLKKLASAIDIDYTSLRQRKHRNQSFSTNTLKRIARFLNVSIYHLTYEEPGRLDSFDVKNRNCSKERQIHNEGFISDEVYMHYCDNLFEKLPLSKKTPQYVRRAVLNLCKLISYGNEYTQNQHSVGIQKFDEDCRVISAINEIKNCNGQEYRKLRANVFTILSLARENEAFEEVLYICDDLYFSLPKKNDYEDIYIEDICDNISQTLIHRIGDKEISDDLLSTANAGAGSSPDFWEYDPWVEAKNRYSQLKKEEYNYRRKLRTKGVRVENKKRGRPRNDEYEGALPAWLKD